MKRNKKNPNWIGIGKIMSVHNDMIFYLFFFETGSCDVAQADLEFSMQPKNGLEIMILTPQPPEFWDYT